MSLEDAKIELKNLFDTQGLPESDFFEFADTHLQDLIDKCTWTQHAFSDAKKLQHAITGKHFIKGDFNSKTLIGDIDRIIQRNALKFSDKCKESLGDMSDDEVDAYHNDAAALAYFEVLCEGGCPVTEEHKELYKLAISMGTVAAFSETYTETSKEVQRFIELAAEVGMEDVSAIQALQSFGVKFSIDSYSQAKELAFQKRKDKTNDSVLNTDSGSFTRKAE